MVYALFCPSWNMQCVLQKIISVLIMPKSETDNSSRLTLRAMLEPAAVSMFSESLRTLAPSPTGAWGSLHHKQGNINSMLLTMHLEGKRTLEIQQYLEGHAQQCRDAAGLAVHGTLTDHLTGPSTRWLPPIICILSPHLT